MNDCKTGEGLQTENERLPNSTLVQDGRDLQHVKLYYTVYIISP